MRHQASLGLALTWGLNLKVCWLPHPFESMLALVNADEWSPCFRVGYMAQHFCRDLQLVPDRATFARRVFSRISTEVLQHRVRLVTRLDHGYLACRQQPNTQLLPGKTVSRCGVHVNHVGERSLLGCRSLDLMFGVLCQALLGLSSRN